MGNKLFAWRLDENIIRRLKEYQIRLKLRTWNEVLNSLLEQKPIMTQEKTVKVKDLPDCRFRFIGCSKNQREITNILDCVDCNKS